MLTLPIAIIFILLAIYARGFIRKHSIKLYIVVTIISILAFLITKFPLFFPIQKGAFGLSFFYVVMLTGALKNKSKLRIALFSVRKEYSILGFIIISPHALNNFIKYVMGDISIPIFGIIAYSIMIPLFITSFTIVRKKFKYTAWKNLQRFAYISYILLFVHLMVNSESPNKIVYIILFVFYGVLKAIYEIKKYTSKKANQVD